MASSWLRPLVVGNIQVREHMLTILIENHSNDYRNLEWLTHKENITHSVDKKIM
jgi:hypothetical protein